MFYKQLYLKLCVIMHFCPPPFAKAGDIQTHSSVCLSLCPSVCLSACHKNFNLAHTFWSINDRALIFGMLDPCVKPFQLTTCGDLDLDLWPTSRSKLLPGGEPQFFEYACLLMCCGCDTFYIVSVHLQWRAFIYTLCCVAGIHGGCG